MDIQQSSQNPIEPEMTNSPAKKQTFKKYLISAGVIILLIAGGYVWYKNQGSQSSLSNKITVQGAGITREQKLAQLNERERSSLEAKLKTLEKEISDFNAQTSQDDKDKKYIQISGVQRSLGLYEESLASLAKVSEEYKSQSRVYLGYALTYKDMGDLIKTAENAKKAVELDPENHQPWIIYLESDQNLSNEERQLKYKDAVLRTDYHPDVLVSYAKFLEMIGNYKEAIEQYKKAGEKDPDRKSEFDAEITRLEAK